MKAEMDASIKKIEEQKPPEPPAEPPKQPPAAEPPAVPPTQDKTPPEPPVETPEDKEAHWKEKFSKSSQEALVLNMKNKEMSRAFEDAAALPEPTEDELKKEFSEWDDMTSTEKKACQE